MSMYIVALTGATGNMGLETLRQVLQIDSVKKVKILVREKSQKQAKKLLNKYKDKLEVVIGDISNKNDCIELLKDSHYILNLAAVIPPKTDKFPKESLDTNYTGIKNIVDILEATEENKRAKLVHISTVALYGNRDEKHPWGRVGDPLLISPYDIYSYGKLLGERYVLDSSLEYKAIIRQTAMIHDRMLSDNMNDGLMFHTCYNSPLEWSTANDSGLLMKRIIEEDINNKLDSYFWKGCFNLGAKAENRIIGYDTFNEGFKLIGGSTKKFMKPHWNAIRNFHGLWYYDGERLEKLFQYQKDSVNEFWKQIEKKNWYFSLAKIVPPKLISFFAIERLLNDKNSPTYWYKNKEYGKIIATFGSVETFEKLSKDWNSFNLLKENKDSNGNYIDYEELRNIKNAKLLDHGYDESIPDCDIDFNILNNAAKFRGGELLSKNIEKGDLYSKLEWKCSEGHSFIANAFTVIKAGHWCEKCMENYTWNFDLLSKKNKFFAQLWYDTHKEDENIVYYFDKDFKAQYKKI